FDSKAEGEFYKLLKASPGAIHIDVHPTVTLPGGIRYKPDFGVISARGWTESREGRYHNFVRTWDDLKIEYYEVKGAITPDFRTKRKLFDKFDPMAPLKVFRKTRKGWDAI